MATSISESIGRFAVACYGVKSGKLLYIVGSGGGATFTQVEHAMWRRDRCAATQTDQDREDYRYAVVEIAAKDLGA